MSVRHLASLLVLGAAACSSGKGGSGTGSATGSATSGTASAASTSSTSGSTTGGGRDAGPGACGTDLDCAQLHGICQCGGTRGPCADGGGVCAPTPDTCQPRNGGADCSSFVDCQDSIGNLLCYCRPDATSDAGGFCDLPQPSCGPCTQDADCGNTATLAQVGFCLPLDGGSFCLPEALSTCAGFLGSVHTRVDAGLVVCAPVGDTGPCGGGCNTDADCPAIDAGVCSPSHFCVAPCRPNGCPSGEVCNALDTYLDPGLTLVPTLAQLYGGGECGPACGDAGACAPYARTGGVPLACVHDPAELNGDRCRPAGCLSSVECAATVVPMGAAYIPWCDVFSGNTCVGTACRRGLADGGDCKAGFYCIDDGGQPAGASGAPATGECVVKPCNLESALIACTIDQLCCGEGDAGVSTCPTGVEVGACYPAPNPPWCATCDPSMGPFGQTQCNRPANAPQFGTGLGTSFCQQTMTGGVCQPACDRNYYSSCATGYECADQVIYGADCTPCGANPCQDAGPNPAGGNLFACRCVDDGGTGCPGAGMTPVACTPQGLCSYGTYCSATAHACP